MFVPLLSFYSGLLFFPPATLMMSSEAPPWGSVNVCFPLTNTRSQTLFTSWMTAASSGVNISASPAPHESNPSWHLCFNSNHRTHRSQGDYDTPTAQQTDVAAQNWTASLPVWSRVSRYATGEFWCEPCVIGVFNCWCWVRMGSCRSSRSQRFKAGLSTAEQHVFFRFMMFVRIWAQLLILICDFFSPCRRLHEHLWCL